VPPRRSSAAPIVSLPLAPLPLGEVLASTAKRVTPTPFQDTPPQQILEEEVVTDMFVESPLSS
jgi:hypothetical protein